ncbi:MAG: mechanosensitive ion channel [Xanthomonadales bacterium]|nr:mechanosensitive ion channel [Xanthomonadales bacterium]
MDGWLASLRGFDWQGLLVLGGMRLGGALLILLTGIWLARRLALGSQKALDRAGLDPMLTGFLRNVAYGALVLVVLIAAIGTLGVQTTSLLAVLGAAGLAVGLALQGSLSNIAAGMMLITLRPFRAGDYVKIAGEEGSVEQVMVFQTQLRTPDNRLVTLPNNQITAAPIVNFTSNTRRRADIAVGIGYGEEIARARQVLLGLAGSHDGVLAEPAPVVLAKGLADSSVDLELRVWIATGDFIRIRSELVEAIHRGLGEAGIGIPFPQRDVHLHLPEATGKALARLDRRASGNPERSAGALQSG